MSESEHLRLDGNTKFAAGDYIGAKEAYSQALVLDESNPIIWANRSACSLALNLFAEAELDARKCILIQPEFVKGYYRLSLALLEQNKSSEAIPFISKGLSLDPTNSSLKKLKSRASDAIENARVKGLAKGFLLQPAADSVCTEQCAPGCSHISKDDPTMNICQTCEPSGLPAVKLRRKKQLSKPTAPAPVFSTSEYNMYTELNALLKKIKAGQSNFGIMGGPNMLGGIFAKLLEKSTFASLLFPGSPPDVLEVLPKNLKQLLHWDALTLDLPKIARAAASVLEGVKKRGAAAGDRMDATTEAMLTPQIVQEALAREIVDAVKKISKILSNFKAKMALHIADREAKLQYYREEEDPESYGLELNENLVSSFRSSHCVVQPELFGSEWNDVILSDIHRFVRNEPMSEMTEWVDDNSSILPRVAWIEIESTKSYYPALSEGIKQLHSIPFELNDILENSLELLIPTTGCTLLMHFPVGSKQPMRLDNFVRPAQTVEEAMSDSGIRVTCSYHLIAEMDPQPPSQFLYSVVTTQGTVTTEPSAVREENSIPLLNDQLILHASTQTRNSRTPALKEYFVLQYFVHGK